MAGTPVTGVVNAATDEVMTTPAFVVNNPQAAMLDSSPQANLSIFSNPVEGNIGAATHEGDLGGAA